MKILVFFLAVVCVAETSDYLEKLDRGTQKRPPPAELGDDIPLATPGASTRMCPTNFRKRLQRNAINDDAKKWPRGKSGKVEVPYIFRTQYSNNLKEIIFGAMKAIEDNTCVKFREPNDDDENVIAIMAHKNGRSCYSAGVGITLNNDLFHNIYLSENDETSCFYHDIVIHELMHAIGLDHEHSRADRKDHVDIIWDNVKEGKSSQFDMVGDDYCNYGCPYTYESVMHYRATEFAKGKGLYTMIPTDKDYLDKIGKAETGHPNDYEKINRIYGCLEEAPGHKCDLWVY